MRYGLLCYQAKIPNELIENSLIQVSDLESGITRNNSGSITRNSSVNFIKQEEILKAFLNISSIMLSIRCLDEGIDIPKISHAIILSSSQNPRQFIQRRGRVLRVSENKNKAIIYDCLVKPNNVAYIEKFNTLVVSEIKRSIEFSKDALNKRFALSYLRSGLIKLGIDPDNNLNLDEEDE